MNNRFLCFARTAALAAGIAASLPSSAEILFVEGGGAAAAEASYAFAHPAFRSVVFATPEFRQLAILPPAPVFVMPPPLLWRTPSALAAFPAYPPAAPGSTRPSNRDNVTYNLQRAHAFSQELFNRDAAQPLAPYFLYPWSGALMPVYPPPAPGTNRPSNRDNATYNLERAHRFSMDAYKKR